MVLDIENTFSHFVLHLKFVHGVFHQLHLFSPGQHMTQLWGRHSQQDLCKCPPTRSCAVDNICSHTELWFFALWIALCVSCLRNPSPQQDHNDIFLALFLKLKKKDGIVLYYKEAIKEWFIVPKMQILAKKHYNRGVIYIRFYDFDYNVIFLIMFWLGKC